MPIFLQATLYYPERVAGSHSTTADTETSPLDGGHVCTLRVSVCPEPVSLASVLVVLVVQSFYWLGSLVTVIKESIEKVCGLFFIPFLSIVLHSILFHEHRIILLSTNYYLKNLLIEFYCKNFFRLRFSFTTIHLISMHILNV